MKNILIILLIIAGIVIVSLIGFNGGRNFGGVVNYLDTSSSQITSATSSITATSSQVFSSITKIGQITNLSTTNLITCSLDPTGTLATSSAIGIYKGIIIGADNASGTPNSAMFGECYPGAINCYTHKGAVNCLAEATSTITKWSK